MLSTTSQACGFWNCGAQCEADSSEKSRDWDRPNLHTTKPMMYRGLHSWQLKTEDSFIFLASSLPWESRAKRGKKVRAIRANGGEKRCLEQVLRKGMGLQFELRNAPCFGQYWGSLAFGVARLTPLGRRKIQMERGSTRERQKQLISQMDREA